DAALQLIAEFSDPTFAVIKNTNDCGAASRSSMKEAWTAALAGDPESAFGGVLVCNRPLDAETAAAIREIFLEILIAPQFLPGAVEVLAQKQNRIRLRQRQPLSPAPGFRRVLNGVLAQDADTGNFAEWKEVPRAVTAAEREDLVFANILCKHLKSNAIALVRDRQLVGKGAGQTSRVDALRQAVA